jgi:HAD superfamily hydrolase (TIGR01509 family)
VPDPIFAPELVIFDCDGVLVDSEPLSMRVLLETIAETGLHFAPDEAYRRFLGKSLASTTAQLSAEFGIDLTHAALERMRLRLYDLFRKELKPVPGIEGVLDALDMPFCVASSSQPERIRLSLGVTGLLARFEPNIFSATMVAHGKPAPDLFLYAAERMGVRPQACLVVEDSPAGLEAAARAEMTAFGFIGGSHAGGRDHHDALQRMAPARIFDDMRQLTGFLKRA